MLKPTQRSYLQLAIVPFLLWDRGLPERKKVGKLSTQSTANEEECYQNTEVVVSFNAKLVTMKTFYLLSLPELTFT